MNDKKMQSIILGCARYLAQSGSKLSLAGGSSIKINGTTYTSRQFRKNFKELHSKMSEYVGMSDFFGVVDSLMKAQELSKDLALDIISDNLYDFILHTLKKQSKDSIAGDTSVTSKGYNYANKIPILDRKSGARVIYDNVKKCVDHGTTYDTWKEYRGFQSKDVKEIMGDAVMVADIDYDPFDSAESAIREVNGQETLSINAHVTPTWRKTEIKDPKLPKAFVKFMKFLFPDEKSLDYVYHWLNFMLTDRNHTILLLHGGRGVGKGTFALITKLLCGFENFGEMPSGFFDSRFNGELKYKRVCFFDEFAILKEHMTRWKALPEPFLAIEEKNGKPTTYRNHASFLVCNNTEEIVHLLCDERKFSVPVVPVDGKVDEYIGIEEFEEFARSIEDDVEVLANVGWWILKNGDKGNYTNRKPFVSTTFHEIVEKALTNWQRDLINFIEQKEYEEIPLDSIPEILKGTGRTKIQKFLNVHKDEENLHYAYIFQKSDGTRVIRPTEKYLPKTKTTQENEDNDSFNPEELEF